MCRWTGASYSSLAGYAVECALKARIAKATRKHDFPDTKKADASHRHNLRELLKVANLEEARLDDELGGGCTEIMVSCNG